MWFSKDRLKHRMKGKKNKKKKRRKKREENKGKEKKKANGKKVIETSYSNGRPLLFRAVSLFFPSGKLIFPFNCLRIPEKLKIHNN